MEGPNSDIVAIPFGEDGESQAIVATPAAEGLGGISVSPDGRWLAYWADPTGRAEIWVRPLSGPGAAVRVSADGGSEPIWSRDGRRLFYRAGADVWTTDVDPTSVDFSFTPPVLLFSGNYVRGEFLQPPNYDVAPDGRFLMLKWLDGGDPGELPLMVLTNWMAELERAAP